MFFYSWQGQCNNSAYITSTSNKLTITYQSNIDKNDNYGGMNAFVSLSYGKLMLIILFIHVVSVRYYNTKCFSFLSDNTGSSTSSNLIVWVAVGIAVLLVVVSVIITIVVCCCCKTSPDDDAARTSDNKALLS